MIISKNLECKEIQLSDGFKYISIPKELIEVLKDKFLLVGVNIEDESARGLSTDEELRDSIDSNFNICLPIGKAKDNIIQIAYHALKTLQEENYNHLTTSKGLDLGEIDELIKYTSQEINQDKIRLVIAYGADLANEILQLPEVINLDNGYNEVLDDVSVLYFDTQAEKEMYLKGASDCDNENFYICDPIEIEKLEKLGIIK